MNATATVQAGLAAPVQGRMGEARVKDDATGGALEAGEEFDDLLSQGSDAAVDPVEAEPATDEGASGSRQAVTVMAFAGLGLALAVPDGEAGAAAAPEAAADPMATLKATLKDTLAAAGQPADMTDIPDIAPRDPAAATDAGSAAEALALLDSASEDVGTAPKPAAPALRSDETTVTIAMVKRETHFAPVAPQHLAAAGAQAPLSSAMARPEAIVDGDGGEKVPDAPRAPTVVAQRLGGSETDGKSDTGARDEGGGDRRPGQASAVSGAELAGAVAGTGEASRASSPAQQIARRIAGELGLPGSQAGARLEATQSGGADGMTKVLRIQLEPANLGTVTVRVTLKDNVLSLHVEAARHETALAIDKDRELLSGALKRSGYMVDGITAQVVDGPRSNAPVQAAADAQSSFSSSTQSQSGHSQSGQQSELRNTRTDGNGDESSSQRGSEPAAGVNDSARGVARGASGELYV